MKLNWKLLIGFGLFFTKLGAQLSFTLPASVCSNNSLAVSANTGTLTNPQITWLASPNAVFSNSTSANTSVTFTSTGNYTLVAVAISGTMMAFMQNTLDVVAVPLPTLVASSASVCPLSTFTLTASPLAGATYSFGLPGAIAVANGSSNVYQVNPPNLLPAVFEVSVGVSGCVGTASVSVQQLQLQPQVVSSSNAVCLGYSATLTAFGMLNYTYSILSPTPALIPNGNTQSLAVSPSIATVYQVLGESMGCTGTATISIGISPPLNINISLSSPTTCIMNNTPKLSKPVNISASGAASYIWDPPITPTLVPGPPGLITVRPQVTTCFTVTGATAVCSGSASKCITVTPQFTLGIHPPISSICLGDTLSLSLVSVGFGAVGSPSAFTYSWTESPNAPPISMSSYLTHSTQVFPQNSTSYTLEAWDTQTCISLPQVATVQVFQCTGLDEQNGVAALYTVFPNPAKESCVLKSTGAGFSEVKLFELNGRWVKTYSSSDGQSVQELELEVFDLLPGVYFLQTNTADSEGRVYKLIKF